MWINTALRAWYGIIPYKKGVFSVIIKILDYQKIKWNSVVECCNSIENWI